MNTLQEFSQTQIKKDVPKFQAGDTLRVHVRVVEGNKERIQVFEGVCIARHNAGVSSTFTVRKISYGEGVERVFPLFSPRLDKIEVARRGDVRRARLYYLRGRSGKETRIREKRDNRDLAVRNAEKAAAKAAAEAKV